MSLKKLLGGAYKTASDASAKVAEQAIGIRKMDVEEKYIKESIIAARKIQTFLWGVSNGSWGIKEWRRMFIKRVKKIEDIDYNNPHAMVELKKRLLQNAALSIALLAIIDGKNKIEKDSEIPSNLPNYKEY